MPLDRSEIVIMDPFGFWEYGEERYPGPSRKIDSVKTIRIVHGNRNRNAFNDKPIERTKRLYPYSYEPFYIFAIDGELSEEMKKGYNSSYHDRMLQWDYDKFEKACKVLEKGSFSQQTPEVLTEFLRIYFEDDKVVLIGLIEGCNVGNGYPYWIFEWYSPNAGK